MAQAVLEKFPEGKIAIGPPIDDGFYYDFDLPRPLTPEDLDALEIRMREIVLQGHAFVGRDVSEAQARGLFIDQPYKLELIDRILEGEAADGDDPPMETPALSIYQHGPFFDLCRGPHLGSTREINPQAIKLLSTGGAYWRGDERRPMLQRIYGTAWSTPEELKQYLDRREEIDRRDHRRRIKDLDLVSFHEEGGPGLAYWHPKGSRTRVVIEDYWRRRHYEEGYDIVFTPHIGRAGLWQVSGHLDFYKDSMYAPMEIDGQQYYLRPMNCPFHILIYKSRLHSYRELPLRWAELGTVYRYERSGTLHGLMRVRGFTQDDAHIICMPEQVDDEIQRVLDFALDFLKGFGFEDFRLELSVRDPQRPEEYLGRDDLWQQAESSLARAMVARGLTYERMEGEAAFYGPKIDLKIKDALGRAWQCTTIQFDFNLPERFEMKYRGEDGKDHRPVMIHRVLMGAVERFFGVLLEHYSGALPVWLAPVQAIIVPIADRHMPGAMSVMEQLRRAGVRAEVDRSDGRMQAKIREAQVQKVPYILVIGDKEIEAGLVNVRLRDGTVVGALGMEAFIAMVGSATSRARPDGEGTAAPEV
jgi:threonyl-tRNA synthetase